MSTEVYNEDRLKIESAWGGITVGRQLEVSIGVVGTVLTMDKVDALILSLIRWRLVQHKRPLPRLKEVK